MLDHLGPSLALLLPKPGAISQHTGHFFTLVPLMTWFSLPGITFLLLSQHFQLSKAQELC